MKKAYASLYSEDSFEGISVPFELKSLLEEIMNDTEDLITDVFDNYEDYKDNEVEMSHYTKDGSNGTVDINSVGDFKKWFFDYFDYRIVSGRVPIKIIETIKNSKEIEPSKVLTDDEARIILEDVIDTLIEVGNGTTDEQLHQAADKLLNFRDNWLDKVL